MKRMCFAPTKPQQIGCTPLKTAIILLKHLSNTTLGIFKEYRQWSVSYTLSLKNGMFPYSIEYPQKP